MTARSTLIRAGAAAGAILAIAGLAGGAWSTMRPYAQSDDPPLVGMTRFDQFAANAADTFKAIQTESQATSASLCDLYTRLSAEAQAKVNAKPTDAAAIGDLEHFAMMRETWCGIAKKSK